VSELMDMEEEEQYHIEDVVEVAEVAEVAD